MGVGVLLPFKPNKSMLAFYLVVLGSGLRASGMLGSTTDYMCPHGRVCTFLHYNKINANINFGSWFQSVVA